MTKTTMCTNLRVKPLWLSTLHIQLRKVLAKGLQKFYVISQNYFNGVKADVHSFLTLYIPLLVSLQVVWNGVQLLLGDQTGSEIYKVAIITLHTSHVH